MVVNESEALRWVTKQWQRLNGKDEISGVGGKLWEFRKNGCQRGDYSRQQEPSENVEHQMRFYNDVKIWTRLQL